MEDIDNQDESDSTPLKGFPEKLYNRVADEGVRFEQRKEMLDSICGDTGVSQLKERLDEAQEQLEEAERELCRVISRS